MRRRLGTCIVVLLLGLPGVADAQGRETQVAASGEARLLASPDETGGVCLLLKHRRGSTGGCAEQITRHEPYVLGADGAAGGAVAAEVTQVEVEWPDGTRSAVPTATHGSFGDRRFFAATHGKREPWLVRHLGADGALLNVTEHGDGPFVAGPVTLASGGGRRDGGRWSARAWLARALVPGPGAPDRTAVIACLQERHANGATTTRCSSGEPRLDALINGAVFATGDHTLGTRDPHRLVLAAMLGPGAASVDLHLGDGRRVRARVRELAGVRFVTHPVPARSAVRRVVVRDAAGAQVDEHVVALAPGILGDDGHGGLYSDRTSLPGTPEVAAGPVQDGEGVLKVREIGARLCAEVERTHVEEIPCGLTPVTARDSLLAGGASEHHGVVGGVVSPDVAEVELEELTAFAEPGPAKIRVATQASSPYAGAFAPHVRTFVGLLPVGGQVRVRLLDAQGAELAETTVDAAYYERLTEPSRSRTRLRAGRVRLRSDSEDSSCVYMRDAGADLVHQACTFGASELEVLVACRPAASVVILSSKNRRGLVLRTARGRLLRPRRLRMASVPHAVFVVPAPDAPRLVRWRGGRVRLGPVPSPREQCGYEISRYLPR